MFESAVKLGEKETSELNQVISFDFTFKMCDSASASASELQRLLESSSDVSGAQTPWTDEYNPPVSIVEALARLPPPPPRRQVARQQRTTVTETEVVHVFPETQGMRAMVTQVGQRIRRRVRGITRVMRRWLARTQTGRE